MGMSNQTEEKELFHAVSLSGGKDSTAMLLLMIERGLPIDAVLTADTGMEFPEMYEHLQKLDDYLFAERGLHLTWLRHPKGFEWLMFEEKKQRPASIENRQRLGVSLYGNGWPGPRVRWCTGQLKTHLIHKEINRLKGQYKAVSYVGIAADEPKRIKNERYPLMDWGITEKEALRICYDRGYDFGGLYQIYRRCSCWCCPLQGIGELRKLRQHHPELWERLREMQGDYNLYVYCYRREALDRHLKNAERGICFVDPQGKTLFRIPDGDSIRVLRPDGTQHDHICRYIDDHRAEIGSGHLYGMVQFAQQMEQTGSTFVPLRSSLPKQCYSLLLDTGNVVILKRGETGYYKTDIPHTSKEEAHAIVEEYNRKLGVTRAQEEAMKGGSMFGFDKPIADPANYDAQGQPLKRREKDRGDAR